jgi:nicotinamide-nucleotide adenylyltransferase
MINTLDALEQILKSLCPEATPRVILTRRSFASKPLKLAILDSSFNPPTRAHRNLLQTASQQFQLDHGLLLLAKTNVDKTVFGASLPQRLQMMELLARDLKNASVGVTAHGRFVDKAKALKQRFGTGTQLYFVLGYDTVSRLFDPTYYEDMTTSLKELFALAQVIYTNRAGHSRQTCLDMMNSAPAAPYGERLHFVVTQEPYLSMSSTEARRRSANADPTLGELVPAAIRDYLEGHSCYREKPIGPR